MQNNKSVKQKIEENPEMNSYFASLPQMVRETIIMSSADINDVNALRSVAEKLMSGDNAKLKIFSCNIKSIICQ